MAEKKPSLCLYVQCGMLPAQIGPGGGISTGLITFRHIFMKVWDNDEAYVEGPRLLGKLPWSGVDPKAKCQPVLISDYAVMVPV